MVTYTENDSSFKEIVQHSEERITRKCIKCPQCGESILMIPTLKEMITAIENHVSTHRNLRCEEGSEVPNTPYVRNSLTEQVLLRAADSSIETPINIIPWL